MRKIGSMDKNQAQLFSDYLAIQNIENTIRGEEEEKVSLWVHEEGKIEEGKKLLTEFLQNPNDETYRAARSKAAEKKKEEQKAVKKARENFINVSGTWQQGANAAYVTVGLILISVFVALISQFGSNIASLKKLFIVDLRIEGDNFSYYTMLVEIKRGEVWRLVTPMFIHFGFFHLLFNMMWLFQLGSMIERIQKRWFLLFAVIFISTLSNVSQYMVSGPLFGGMSGVVFGLFGYVWLRYKKSPFSGYYLSQQDAVLMMLWFFLCFTGAFGAIANTAHAVGLLSGLFLGIVVESRSYFQK